VPPPAPFVMHMLIVPKWEGVARRLRRQNFNLLRRRFGYNAQRFLLMGLPMITLLIEAFCSSMLMKFAKKPRNALRTGALKCAG